MSLSNVPSGIVEVKRDGWSKGRGYVILSDETGLIIHYLSEFDRHRKDDGRPKKPVRPYEEFVRKSYYWNPGAVSRILIAAKEGPLKEFETLRTEFNSLLASGELSNETTERYIDKAEEILRR